MRQLLYIFAGLILIQPATAQQVRPATSAQIYHEIAQLKHLTKVLYLAAHPDDENTRMLAWLVNDQHIPTAYLSLTRGDGGQNILGSEQGAALGLIRTHELLEARKLDGAGQFFTRAIDFGFSKTAEETFKHWNEYLLTYDVVRVIRQYRPDVIIARFPPDSRAGHGQHAASAIIAEKAFKLAGDKLQYTEQLKDYPAWQAKRLVWNTYRFSSTNTTADSQFKLEVGHYSPLLGMGYGELAGISRSIHRSQGAGTPSTPGVQKEYFSHVAGDTITSSLFDGIDMSWKRVGRPEIGQALDKILQQFDFTDPSKSLPALLALRKQIATVKDGYWRTEKLKELDQAILHASGLMLEAATRQPQAVAGGVLPFNLRVIARSPLPVQLLSVQWPMEDTAVNLVLAPDSLYSFDHYAAIPANEPVTQPYWMTDLSTTSEFRISHDSLRGLPQTPNNLVAHVSMKIGEQPYTIPVPLSYKKLDPVRGDVVEQLRVVPEVSIEPYASLLITQPDGSLKTSVRIHSYADIAGATLRLFSDYKELIRIPGLDLRTNEDTTVSITISAAQSNKISKDDYYMDAELTAGGKKYNRTLRLIRYDHLPTLQYLTLPASKVIHNDWKVTAKKIGFIEGAGDFTVTLLRLAGLQVDVLRDADMLDASRLKSYDAIITGVRAVNTEKKMSYWMPVLLQYVHNGGTLIMQYNTLQDMSTTQLGPYPITLANKRVTEENAAIGFLDPAHRLLNYPNKITQADFSGWQQERGLYFPVKWDDKYQSLFSMNDSGEEPLTGGTLYASYGKGHYVYTSLAFFRQLPAGNKGAIRLLMNMLSVGK
jgi:LmbE family N-acetylglucosaminyl deacetylase